MPVLATHAAPTPSFTLETKCAVCDGPHLEPVLELPDLPLTGLIHGDDDGTPARFDQTLMTCGNCGHVQLLNIVSPGVLYGKNYVYRTSAGQGLAAPTRRVLEFIRDAADGRTFACALEIGCNDLSTLLRLDGFAADRVGIDPIWQFEPIPDAANSITVIAEFVEDVDLESALPEKPDLIISTHNLEHIRDPSGQLRRILDAAADDALIVVEVPALEAMSNHLRFDKVFHEHLHYFSLTALRTLVARLGCEVVHYSASPTWGGSHQIAFQKNTIQSSAKIIQIPRPDARQLGHSYRLFKGKLAAFSEMAQRVERPILGYGAGQQLPVLAYHLQTDLSFLNGLLDDDPARAGLRYRTIDLEINVPERVAPETISDSAILVTSLDAARPILRRLGKFEPRSVLLPSDVI